MKVKELLKDNKKYLQDQIDSLKLRLHTYQMEADKIATDLKETQRQIDVINKVIDFTNTIPNGANVSGGGK